MRNSVLVQRNFHPVWQERGWNWRGNHYFGYYRTQYGSYEGRIVYLYSGRFRFIIKSPPECLRQHPHWQCFRHRGYDEYEVHFSKEGRTIDEGILAIEKIIIEAFEGAYA